jgi:predicted short-subunit dehydrogenase-like oxidoreductase (DUF2520 family)
MKQKPLRTLRLRVAIVGAGKVGSVLGRVLVEEGARITAIVSRSRASARAAGRFLRCANASTALTAIPRDTECVFITTPHDAVEEVARTLAGLEGLDFGTLAVCHASGMLTAAALDPCAVRGAAVFSFHPLQTFPRDFAPRDILPWARGISYGVDGSPRGVRMARRLASVLQGRIVLIPPGRRELYHAACVVASNHLTTMLAELEAMLRAVLPGQKRFMGLVRPILDATLANVAATSPAAALSGPVARGGIGTVARHLEAVRDAVPELLPYYTRMSLETVRLAGAKGSLTADQRTAMVQLIRSFTDESMHTRENE